ncbi:trefoil factor 2-like isoform X2 [Actinia tenebrosa]|uniref:Trefoil factor 2-like isoform X2 n=1 Tax=Actinia tenebrosa TaxID=6105 RepID=A0A6P8IC00_ACTTE|nr:trefoil factor 2-like isoform X2 [Actinia tenebrosa]
MAIIMTGLVVLFVSMLPIGVHTGVNMSLECSKHILQPRYRANCGFPGITKDQCENGHGGGRCCYDTSVKGVPWCFFGIKRLVCYKDVINPKNRVNCGFPGITKEQCEKRHGGRRCCYDDSVESVPWCFFVFPSIKRLPIRNSPVLTTKRSKIGIV